VSHPEHGRFGAYGGQYVPETLMGALEELEDIWRQVLTMQFHDILPGSSIACHSGAADSPASMARTTCGALAAASSRSKGSTNSFI